MCLPLFLGTKAHCEAGACRYEVQRDSRCGRLRCLSSPRDCGAQRQPAPVPAGNDNRLFSSSLGTLHIFPPLLPAPNIIAA
jgi:hypothetical protein